MNLLLPRHIFTTNPWFVISSHPDYGFATELIIGQVHCFRIAMSFDEVLHLVIETCYRIYKPNNPSTVWFLGQSETNWEWSHPSSHIPTNFYHKLWSKLRGNSWIHPIQQPPINRLIPPPCRRAPLESIKRLYPRVNSEQTWLGNWLNVIKDEQTDKVCRGCFTL